MSSPLTPAARSTPSTDWVNRNHALCAARGCTQPIAGWSVILYDRQTDQLMNGCEIAPVLIGYCAADLDDQGERPDAGRWPGVRAVGVVWLTREGPRGR